MYIACDRWFMVSVAHAKIGSAYLGSGDVHKTDRLQENCKSNKHVICVFHSFTNRVKPAPTKSTACVSHRRAHMRLVNRLNKQIHAELQPAIVFFILAPNWKLQINLHSFMSKICTSATASELVYRISKDFCRCWQHNPLF